MTVSHVLRKQEKFVMLLNMIYVCNIQQHNETVTFVIGKMGSTSGGNINQNQPQQAQGLTALLVMIAVLCILLAYCFWGAPWCRSFCRRRVCCFCPMDDPEGIEMGSTAEVPAATPTIILLPFGRMLVVDGAVFAQLQADSRGLDLMELGENIIRTQRYQTGSSPSIFQVSRAELKLNIIWHG